METYKERSVFMDYPSEVYFNVHKQTFSMKQNGVVVLHSDTIVLTDVTFKVSEAGRQRVLAEQKKNVHAKVCGNFQGNSFQSLEGFREAYYNPYETETFIEFFSQEPVYEADIVILTHKAIFYK